MKVSGTNLRNAFFIAGGLLVFLSGIDPGLIAAGLAPIGIIPANLAHLMAMAGAGLIGYAKTGTIFGDADPQQQVAQVLQAKLEASQPLDTIQK